MLKAVKSVIVIYAGREIPLKKGEILDVTKTFGYIDNEAYLVSLHLKNKYGLIDAEKPKEKTPVLEEEKTNDSPKSDRRDSKEDTGKRK